MGSKGLGRRIGSVALVAATFLAATTANAALIELDLNAPGDGLLTLDTGTGLKWLDVTTSLGRSVADVSGQLGPGGDFEGFRFAATSEILTLFGNAGVRTLGADQPANFYGVEDLGLGTTAAQAAWDLIALVGITAWPGHHEGATYAAFDDGGDPATSGYAAVAHGVGFAGDVTVTNWSRVATINQPVDFVLTNQGNWLVSMPEPETLALLAAGLFGLALTRARRRSVIPRRT